jgi:hypothetical protein
MAKLVRTVCGQCDQPIVQKTKSSKVYIHRADRYHDKNSQNYAPRLTHEIVVKMETIKENF